MTEAPTRRVKPTRPPGSRFRIRGRTVTLWILFISLFPLFLGGDLERWLQGTVLCLIGTLFILAPPRHPAGHGIGWVALALFAVSLSAFLPAHWLGLPEWRINVTRDLGIALPGTLSPQPWLSLDAVILLGAGLLWIYFLAARGWESGERRFAMRALAASLLGFTIVSFAFYFAHWTPPLWQGQQFFGPIANRNQMAIALCLTALVLLGCAEYDFKRKQKFRAIVWAAGIPLVFAGLVVNYSRAGILLFFAGVGVWILITAAQKRSASLFAIAGSLLILLIAVFFLYGGKTLDRFSATKKEMTSSIATEARVGIFSETLRMIGNAPLFGVGFGNFSPVYALSRDLDDVSLVARVAQPDNDWLWLAAETGLAGLLLGAALIFVIAKQAFPFHSERRRSRRSTTSLRVVSLICVAVFLIDSFVNIPGHRIAIALPGFLLFSLALRSSRHNKLEHSSTALAIVYRLGGLALLAAGVTWITATVQKLPLPGLLGIERLTDAADEAEDAEEFQKAYDLITEAIRLEPLRYRHYFKRAAYAAGAGFPLEQIVSDFELARKLEPTHPSIPLGEAEFWLRTRPVLAVPALEEAMRRMPHLAAFYYLPMARRSGIDPLFQSALADLAFKDPEFQLAYLSAVSSESPISEVAVVAQLEQIIADDPLLEKWTPRQKKELFHYWYKFGDRDELVAQILKRSDWEEAGWKQLCQHYNAAREFEMALNVAFKHLSAPSLPSFKELRALEDLRTAFTTNPEDISVGIRLYEAEANSGNQDAAITALKKVTQSPECPSYSYFLLAKAYHERGDAELAWRSLETYLRENPQP